MRFWRLGKSMDGLSTISAHELVHLIASKAVSPVEVTQHALDLAEDTQGTLNAFFHLMPREAIEAARQAERAVLQGDSLGPLHGIPFSAKDLIAVEGAPYASGSRAMAHNISGVDAPSVARAKAAGGILIGKTTTSEFGCKPVGDCPLTGITRNPFNLAKSPGGSSAGAAASVAAGITPFALGTDGGGSIRIPAGFCGLAGIKAQFGRVPVWPTSATPTLAHVGPLARNIHDAALLLSTIAGYDERDPASVAAQTPDFLAALNADVAGLRIAVSPTLGYARPDPDVVAAVNDAASVFEQLGCKVERIDKVFATDPADLWTAEFYAGVGTRLRPILEKDRALLDPAVADILDAALAQDMRDYYEKVFARYALREHVRAFFQTYDILLSPVAPVSSIEVGKNIPDQLLDRNLVSWIFYTYPFNLTGQPALTIPAGLNADGMPIGVQLVGRSMREADIIAAASAFEKSRLMPIQLFPIKG